MKPELLSDDELSEIMKRWDFSDIDDCFGDSYCEQAFADIQSLYAHIRYLEQMLIDKDAE